MHSPEEGRQQHDDAQQLVKKWRQQHEPPADLIYCRRTKTEMSLSECQRYLDSVRHDWYMGTKHNRSVRTTHKNVMACVAGRNREACSYYQKRQSVIGEGGRKIMGIDGVIRMNGKPWNGNPTFDKMEGKVKDDRGTE